MKKLLLTAVLAIISCLTFSQTISPSVDNEYCPNQEYTFSVTLPGNAGAPNFRAIPFTSYTVYLPTVMSFTYTPPGGANVTCNIRVKFLDQKPQYAQGFEIFWQDNTASPATEKKADFVFKKVKVVPDVANVLGGNQPFDAPICSTVTKTYSFTPLNYYTGNTSGGFNSVAYKTISNYECAVPKGWQVNGIVSTSINNYIACGNIMTITSDATNGAGEYIRVRAIGDCNAHKEIGALAINRPSLSISIIGEDRTSCDVANYSIPQLPACISVASINWSLSPSNVGSLSPGTNGYSCLVTKLLDANAKLTCNVNLADGKVLTNTTNIAIGAAPPTNIIGIDPLVVYAAGQYLNLSVPEYSDSYEWYVGGATMIGSYNNGQQIRVKLDGCYPRQTTYNALSIAVALKNSCGTSPYLSRDARVRCDGGESPEEPDPILNVPYENIMKASSLQKNNVNVSYRVTISPNPAKSNIVISLKGTDNKAGINSITSIRIYNISGNLVLKREGLQASLQENINVSALVSGVYFVEVSDGKNKVTQKIVITK